MGPPGCTLAYRLPVATAPVVVLKPAAVLALASAMARVADLLPSRSALEKAALQTTPSRFTTPPHISAPPPPLVSPCTTSLRTEVSSALVGSPAQPGAVAVCACASDEQPARRPAPDASPMPIATKTIPSRVFMISRILTFKSTNRERGL